MGTPYIGEIRMVSFNFAPKGWAQCNGQIFPINQNQALFSLLGTSYGGDGRINFALPDLRGRTPFHQGQPVGQSPFNLGQRGGEEMHTLTVAETPAHNHFPVGSTSTVNTESPLNNFWGASAQTNLYSPTANTAMAANAFGNNAGGQPHENRAPYLVVNFIIALTGISPSRS
jgi:microcystin-dependent protein